MLGVNFGSNLYTDNIITGIFIGWRFLGDCKKKSSYWYFKKNWKKDRISSRKKDLVIVKVFRV